MSSMHSADVRKQLADLDAALPVLLELEYGEANAAPVLRSVGRLIGSSLPCVLASAPAWDRTCRRATARRS